MKKTKPENWKLTPKHYRDMHGKDFVEALCEHGIGHHMGIHGCDGCCSDWPKLIEDSVSRDE